MFLFISILCGLFIATVDCADFNHPNTPTLFWWFVYPGCMSACTLNVASKNTNQTVAFRPNVQYLSCYYQDNYTWSLDCGNSSCSRFSNDQTLNLSPEIKLRATVVPQTIILIMYQLVSIEVPINKSKLSNTCLVVEVDINYDIVQQNFHGSPDMRSYGKNYFNCSPSVTENSLYVVPYQTQTHGSFTNYHVELTLGCGNDTDLERIVPNNGSPTDPTDLIATYYFKLNSVFTNITYHLETRPEIVPVVPVPINISVPEVAPIPFNISVPEVAPIPFNISVPEVAPIPPPCPAPIPNPYDQWTPDKIAPLLLGLGVIVIALIAAAIICYSKSKNKIRLVCCKNRSDNELSMQRL